MTIPFSTNQLKHQRGVSMIEFTLISPVVLLLGLGMFQLAMLMHTKSALNYAMLEAARVGAFSNGDVDKIIDGLAAGLVPFRGGGSNIAELATKKAEIVAELTEGGGAGWFVLKQLSPTTSTYTDWAEDALDDAGNTIKEIPNANLAFLRCTKSPQAGTVGSKSSSACASGEPVGASSKQTLADANILKLKMTYGVRVAVPIIGTIIAKSLSMAAGCKPAKEIKVGALSFGTPTVAAQPADCAFYDAAEPRFPVSIEVTMRMQSPLRTAGNGQANLGGVSIISANTKSANTTGPSLGNGTVDTASNFAPVAVATLNPGGLKYADDKAGNPSLTNDNKGFGGGDISIGTTNDFTRKGSEDSPLGVTPTQCKPETPIKPPSFIPPNENEPPKFTPIPQEPKPSPFPVPRNSKPSGDLAGAGDGAQAQNLSLPAAAKPATGIGIGAASNGRITPTGPIDRQPAALVINAD